MAWVSAAKQASHTLELFIARVSAAKQASHTLKLFIAWVSATKQASHTLKFFTAWVSATKQASHTHKLFTLRRKKGTGGRNSQVTHDTLPGAVLRKQRSLCAARTFSHRT